MSTLKRREKIEFKKLTNLHEEGWNIEERMREYKIKLQIFLIDLRDNNLFK